jgi:hypothetical protein
MMGASRFFMADQNHFDRSINTAAAGFQTLSADGNASSSTAVLEVITSDGNVTVTLPSQSASTGTSITLVKPDDDNDVTVAVQSGDSMDGSVDDTSFILSAAGAWATAVFSSTGSSWVRVA